MRTEPFHLIGAGGHARVVFDAMLAAGVAPDHIVVRDDNPRLDGKDFLGVRIATPAASPTVKGAPFHIAIGDARIRSQFTDELESLGGEAHTIVHPAATISRYAVIGAGSFIAAQALVAPSARIGRAVIVNHGAVVDHDCIVGGFSHISPNATLGGAVTVGERTLIGAGAVVLPMIKIGNDVIVGAGAVVTSDVREGMTVMGIPAVPVK
jgi:sugar O-acyltransferase (sialic acid O-acetyltransferase NeuD family)